MTGVAHADARFLRASALGLTALLIVLALAALRRGSKPRFEEMDVERVNIVEQDGTPRLMLFNAAHAPGAFIHGKEYPHPGRGNFAGILYFNDEGTENGGMATFDQFDQDQTVRIEQGLDVWDRPAVPILEVLTQVQAVRALPGGPEKARALTELGARVGGARRVQVGIMPDSSAAIVLSDPRGKPRLRLVVDPLGTPRVDFLDQQGRVTRTLTGSTPGKP